jgi:hypothetical protein
LTNPVDDFSAWFQRLNRKCDILVSKFGFKWVKLYRYGEGSPTARRMCIDGHATYKPAQNKGCANQAVERDPPREHPGGHALSVPHLIRGVYGDREGKIVAVLREPGVGAVHML